MFEISLYSAEVTRNTYRFGIDDTPTKSFISSSTNCTSSPTPSTHVLNGYKESAGTGHQTEKDENVSNKLVKFVKDTLNTSTLSLAEFKKLLLLHPVGK